MWLNLVVFSHVLSNSNKRLDHPDRLTRIRQDSYIRQIRNHVNHRTHTYIMAPIDTHILTNPQFRKILTAHCHLAYRHPIHLWTPSASASPFLKFMALYSTSAICFHAMSYRLCPHFWTK